jgi:hypothetical protein
VGRRILLEKNRRTFGNYPILAKLGVEVPPHPEIVVRVGSMSDVTDDDVTAAARDGGFCLKKLSEIQKLSDPRQTWRGGSLPLWHKLESKLGLMTSMTSPRPFRMVFAV